MLVTSVLLYIALTLVVGFWASRRVKTTRDFTLAGRKLPAAVVGVTIFATWFGPEYIMGVPGRFVERGMMGIITDQFGTLLCLLLVGFFYARQLYRLKIVTLSDFFQLRYNKTLALATAIIQVITYFFWIAAQFVALGYLFQTVLDLSLYNGILLGAAFVVIYTYIGGMWAVSFTDLLQSVLIVVGLVILLVNVLDETGGVAPLFADRPANFLAFFPEKSFQGWTDYLAMWMAFGIGAIPAQEIYQRVFSARSETAGRNGVFFSALLLFAISIIPLLIGLGAARLHPNLITGGDGQNLIPAMASQYTGEGMQTLFFGALISAILSTSSGAMLSPATIIGENLLKPYLPAMTDRRLLLWTRVSVIVVAAISYCVAINNASIHGLVVSSAVLLMVCLFAPLTWGLYWKRASVAGAWASIVLGGLVWIFCESGETSTDPTIYGTLASCLAMILGSLLCPNKGKTLATVSFQRHYHSNE